MKTGIIFMGMGFELVGIVLASLYLGSMLDKHLSLRGFGVASVLLLGLGGWVAHMIFLLVRMQKANDKDRS